MKEYGIKHHRHPDQLWRGPYATRQEVDDWISEWLEDGGLPDVFYPVTRDVPEWVPAGNMPVDKAG